MSGTESEHAKNLLLRRRTLVRTFALYFLSVRTLQTLKKTFDKSNLNNNNRFKVYLEDKYLI